MSKRDTDSLQKEHHALQEKILNNEMLTPTELLEFLQLSYLLSGGFDDHDLLTSKQHEPIMKEIMKKILGKTEISNEYAEIMGYMNDKFGNVVIQTRFQSPHWYYILTDIVNDIESVKGSILENFDISEDANLNIPCFGTVQSLIFSAEISAECCIDKIIVL